ncbi:hypothetical protein RIF29_37982 [Crotalaria pallida]|uniref:Uncharacterized protein n=1 Tax=Crotalaria pallida TaxID=3830 RepID=A0AAN9DYE6_CROPI
MESIPPCSTPLHYKLTNPNNGIRLPSTPSHSTNSNIEFHYTVDVPGWIASCGGWIPVVTPKKTPLCYYFYMGCHFVEALFKEN